MTADEIAYELRRYFVLEERRERFWRSVHADNRAEYAAAGRQQRARLRALLRSDAFRNVAQGYAAAGDPDVIGLACLVTWLPCLSIFDSESSPHELVRLAREQQRMHAEHVRKLREIAGTLVSDYRDRLNQLALEIEKKGTFALFGAEMGLQVIGDSTNLGTRGAASNPVSAWRGWLIRELHSRLPHFDRTPDKYATVANLLKWARIDGVTPVLVRSILTHGSRLKR